MNFFGGKDNGQSDKTCFTNRTKSDTKRTRPAFSASKQPRVRFVSAALNSLRLKNNSNNNKFYRKSA